MKVVVLTLSLDGEILGVVHESQLSHDAIADLLLKKNHINKQERNGIEFEDVDFEGERFIAKAILPNGNFINVRMIDEVME